MICQSIPFCIKIKSMKKQNWTIIFFGLLVIAFGVMASLFLYSKTLVGLPEYPDFSPTITRQDNPKLDDNPFNDINFKKYDQKKLLKLQSNTSYIQNIPNLKIPRLINYQSKLIEGIKGEKKTNNLRLLNSNKSEINFILEPFVESKKEMTCYTDYKQVNETLIRVLKKDKTNGKIAWSYIKIPANFSIIDTDKFETDFKEFDEKIATKFNRVKKEESRLCTADFDILTTVFGTGTEKNVSSSNQLSTTFYNFSISFMGNQNDLVEFDEVVNAIKV